MNSDTFIDQLHSIANKLLRCADMIETLSQTNSSKIQNDLIYDLKQDHTHFASYTSISDPDYQNHTASHNRNEITDENEVILNRTNELLLDQTFQRRDKASQNANRQAHSSLNAKPKQSRPHIHRHRVSITNDSRHHAPFRANPPNLEIHASASRSHNHQDFATLENNRSHPGREESINSISSQEEPKPRPRPMTGVNSRRNGPRQTQPVAAQTLEVNTVPTQSTQAQSREANSQSQPNATNARQGRHRLTRRVIQPEPRRPELRPNTDNIFRRPLLDTFSLDDAALIRSNVQVSEAPPELSDRYLDELFYRHAPAIMPAIRASLAENNSGNDTMSDLYRHVSHTLQQEMKQGYTEEELRQLRPFSATTAQEDPCCICLDDIRIGDSTLILSCSHIYHEACIKQWLRAVTACPLCKTTVTIDVP